MKGGSVGLTYPMLAKTNYTAWALKMKVYMQAQGVWIAVEPTDPKATIEEKTDKVALAMIYQGIPEEVLLSIAEKKSASEAWEAIKTMCLGAERVKKAKIQTLKTEFESMSMKDSEQLGDFSLKLNRLVTNIRALGEEITESYVVKKLLRAVPSKFLQITSTLEQFGDLENMSVEEAVGSLKAHEERLKGKTEASEGQLMLTKEEWEKKESEEGKLLYTREEWIKSQNKGRMETSSGMRGRGVRDKSKVRCYNCGIYGHYAAECKKPRRSKETKQEMNMVQMDDDEPALLLAKYKKDEGDLMLVNEGRVMPSLSTGDDTTRGESNIWYLDNGASNHMTGYKSKFTDLDESVTGKVKFGDGSTVNIEGKGSVTFECKNGEQRTLREVYYIPSLCNNIISIGQLSEEGNKVVIRGEFLWVFDECEKLLMKVKRSQSRLYKLIIENSRPMCLMSKLDEVSKLWHNRLGHVNYQAMALMFREQMVEGLPKVSQPKDVCTGCLMSKQVKKTFPSQTSYSAKGPLELVHGDICGPISPETAAGKRYFLLLVDD